MIGSIGIDLVETSRIQKLVTNYGDRFIGRILGPLELELYRTRRDRYQFLAGRFAAKEATVKALGKYITERPPLQTIQIVNDTTGQPSLHFETDLAARLSHISAKVSISHEKSHAVAVVMFSEKQ